MFLFIAQFEYSHADLDSLRDHLRDVPCENIFKLSASAAAIEFREWVQVGTDVCIPYCKYQVKPHSSPWFSAACAASIVHRNHFFRLYQQNMSSRSKAKFISSLDQATIKSSFLCSKVGAGDSTPSRRVHFRKLH